MSNAKDPGALTSGGDNPGGDQYGTDADTGQAGTISDNWWQSDGNQTWTDNHDNGHDFQVNDNNW